MNAECGEKRVPRRRRSCQPLGGRRGKLAQQSKNRPRTLVVRLDDFVHLLCLENAEVLDEVENGFDLDQRSSRHVGEATEFFRAAAADAFSEIENDAITSTTPLIRQITFGWWKSIDERARHNRKPSRVLVSLQVLEDHTGR